MKIKAYCWNVNSVNARLERVLNFLKTHQPDVLCLQELKCLPEKYPHKEIEELGYHSQVHGQKTYNGVAILTKEPSEIVQQGIPGFEDPQARYLECFYKGVHWVSAYVPNGQEVGSEKYAYKLNWLEAMTAYLKKSETSQIKRVVTGDFNIALHDIDVHDSERWRGKILCSDKERAALKSILDVGYVDTYREKNPDERAFSWWDYRALGFQKNHGLRIDLVLANKNLAKSYEETGIVRDERKGSKPSDHAPVYTVFDEPVNHLE